MKYTHIKRLIDITLCLILLIITFPIIILSIIVLVFSINKNPFFYQQRPGKNEKLFNIIKLKTMKYKIDENGKLLPDELRLTKAGRIIRKLSIDELPQLINVLKGDMSLIGPRPLLVKYLPYYTNKEKIRHKVRPGITGWAQVNGRNILRWDNRLTLDVWYVENLSFKVDLKIILITIYKVFKRDSITVDVGVLNFKDLDEERRNLPSKSEIR